MQDDEKKVKKKKAVPAETGSAKPSAFPKLISEYPPIPGREKYISYQVPYKEEEIEEAIKAPKIPTLCKMYELVSKVKLADFKKSYLVPEFSNAILLYKVGKGIFCDCSKISCMELPSSARFHRENKKTWCLICKKQSRLLTNTPLADTHTLLRSWFLGYYLWEAKKMYSIVLNAAYEENKELLRKQGIKVRLAVNNENFISECTEFASECQVTYSQALIMLSHYLRYDSSFWGELFFILQ